MNTKNNIKENDKSKFRIHVDDKTLKDPMLTKKMAMVQNANPNVEFDLEPKGSSSSTSMAQMEENNVLGPEAVIEPKDRPTIKYLSNIKDPESKQISQPFHIGGKKYQMVRGVIPDKSIVLGVYCFNDMLEEGGNMIYHVDEFESKIARPMLETQKLTTESETKSSEPESLNLGEYKHFIVNEISGKFKKFKTIPELAATTMLEDEKYMGLKEFKKFFENRVFGTPRRKELAEYDAQPQQPQVDIKRDVDVLLNTMTKNSNVLNKINKINNPIEKSQFLIKIADLIGLGLPKFAETVRNLKTQAKTRTQQPVQPTQAPAQQAPAQQAPAQQPVQQKQSVQQKAQEPVTENTVIKTIKKKDIK